MCTLHIASAYGKTKCLAGHGPDKASWPRSIIFCEAVAIYGVIVAIILSTRLESPFAVRDAETGLFPIQAMTAGYAIYGSGITTGWSNLVCGCVIRPQPCPC